MSASCGQDEYYNNNHLKFWQSLLFPAVSQIKTYIRSHKPFVLTFHLSPDFFLTCLLGLYYGINYYVNVEYAQIKEWKREKKCPDSVPTYQYNKII